MLLSATEITNETMLDLGSIVMGLPVNTSPLMSICQLALKLWLVFDKVVLMIGNSNGKASSHVVACHASV